MVDFKKSEEFQCLFTDSSLKYYYHGYWTCVSQSVDAGYPSLTVLTDFLDIHAGLANTLEPDEEISLELAKNLLHVPRESDAAANPKDLMVENDVPLKVVPPYS
ncbi:UNVERIFIED_CONTAM: hypothetical protein Sangu_0383700 [Sesamum angustifolium]|uniref:Uncharacterized protein n=1 Tax=Sesamum angustifolium TaxID=2727405 RepID=A0AAW2QRY6_9LAMI